MFNSFFPKIMLFMR